MRPRLVALIGLALSFFLAGGVAAWGSGDLVTPIVTTDEIQEVATVHFELPGDNDLCGRHFEAVSLPTGPVGCRYCDSAGVGCGHSSCGMTFTITEPSIVAVEFSPQFFEAEVFTDYCGSSSYQGQYWDSLGSGCHDHVSTGFPPDIYYELTGPHFALPLQPSTNTAQTVCLPPGTYFFDSRVRVCHWEQPGGCPGRSTEWYRREVQIAAIPCGVGVEIVPNSINPRSRGVIPVAILGSDTFDIAEIDVTTLRFGPAEASCKHDLTDEWTCGEHIEDLNLDGFMDLMMHYPTGDTGIVCGDTQATLAGNRMDGTNFLGTDTFETVGCNSSRPPRESNRLGVRRPEADADPQPTNRPVKPRKVD